MVKTWFVFGLVLCGASSACSKPDLTCRWIVKGSKKANLAGQDPVVALTKPWTDLDLPLAHGTVCTSDAESAVIVYKGMGNGGGLTWALIVQKDLENKGYSVDTFESDPTTPPDLNIDNVDFTMSKGERTIKVTMSEYPNSAWKHNPFEVRLTILPRKPQDDY
jgi:hypothetical protein